MRECDMFQILYIPFFLDWFSIFRSRHLEFLFRLFSSSTSEPLFYEDITLVTTTSQENPQAQRNDVILSLWLYSRGSCRLIAFLANVFRWPQADAWKVSTSQTKTLAAPSAVEECWTFSGFLLKFQDVIRSLLAVSIYFMSHPHRRRHHAKSF